MMMRNPFKPKARTFAQAMRAGAVSALTGCALVATPLIGATLLPIPMTYASPEAPAIADRDLPPAKGSQAWVIEHSGCKVAPDGVLPAAAVVDPAGPRSWTRVKNIGPAFEQLVFDGVLDANEWTSPVDHGMRVGVFCR